MSSKISQIVKSIYQNLTNTIIKSAPQPSFRLIEITKIDEEGDYIVTVQITNKNCVFKSKPEQLLADDDIVDQFSPRDIRALTYLGYLGINSPKYKILAQRLSDNSDKMIFALKEKGKKEVIVKTATEIQKESNILKNLNSNDAHLIGYTVASENITEEKVLKTKIQQLLKDSKD